MSKSERAKMLDRIGKRAKRYKTLRENSNKVVSHTRIIYNFLKDIEKIYVVAGDPIEFRVMLNELCKHLDATMKSRDPQVHMEIAWEGGDPDWRTLRCTGVRIKWSNGHVQRNPEVQQEEYIDVMQFLLQDPDTI
jgi:hypothetical protein